VTEQERSLVIPARPRPFHAFRRAKSICAVAFQARGY